MPPILYLSTSLKTLVVYITTQFFYIIIIFISRKTNISLHKYTSFHNQSLLFLLIAFINSIMYLLLKFFLLKAIPICLDGI